ncbi:unnamed protein product, partial [Allacma fusca]
MRVGLDLEGTITCISSFGDLKNKLTQAPLSLKMSGTQELILKGARAAFASGKTRDLTFRETQLRGLLRLLIEHEDDILEALHKDLRKAKLEGSIYELEVVKAEAISVLKHLKEYASKEHLPINALGALDRGYILREPYGLVLILGAWNYPFTLTFKPLIGAIAAGNCVVIKPSEVSAESASIMAKLLPKYIDPVCYPVVLADVDGTKSLLKNKFDYIFYTGSSSVASSILQAAAPNLTPVTLELGGKSPCYIDDSADFKLAAKRILWGKVMNLGMTCIAPDYLLCSRSAQEEFVKVTHQVMKEWYGSEKLQSQPDLPRIINKRHHQRIKHLLDTTKGNIIYGGETDEEDLWIEPTIVVDVQSNDSLMQDEIFGPILPIVNVNSPEEAVDFILDKPKPLALYVFSKKQEVYNKMIESTSSGGVCINDVVWQNAWHGLPFGGVGNSGMGNYHGKYSFDTFSHKRGVLIRGFSYLSEKLGEARYPPYTPDKLKFFKLILKYFEACNVTFSPL